MTSGRSSADAADLVVVGAGIVGLAHAIDAVRRGLTVTVVERDDRVVGASVRNFGHGCFTAQAGTALRYASAAREVWLMLAKDAGFWLSQAGTVVVARAEDEAAVLADFAAHRGAEEVVLLDPPTLRQRVPVGSGLVGGAWFPRDLRIDPRQAVAAIAGWLASRGVEFRWATNVTNVQPGQVHTTRGIVRAGCVVVAVGHDVDRLFVEAAEQAGVRRCGLHMMRIANPHGVRIEPAVLTGSSLLRYDGFAVSAARESLRARLAVSHPQLIEADVNLMFTQHPGGDLIVGDTHDYAATLDPFQAAELDDLILSEIGALLGAAELTVRERWRGVYASAPEPFLIAAPAPDVRVVSVTSGIGMTTALGLAPEVLDGLFV